MKRKLLLFAPITALANWWVIIPIVVILPVAGALLMGYLFGFKVTHIPPGAAVTLPARGTVTPEPEIAMASAPTFRIDHRDGWVMVTVPPWSELYRGPTVNGPWEFVGNYFEAGTLAEVVDGPARFYTVRPIARP